MSAPMIDPILRGRLGKIRRDLLLLHVGEEVSPAAWQEVRDDIARRAGLHRTEALAEGRRYADQVRRELGLPTRLGEQVGRVRLALQIDTSGIEKAIKRINQMAKAFSSPYGQACLEWLDEPTPIYDALKAERGAA